MAVSPGTATTDGQNKQANSKKSRLSLPKKASVSAPAPVSSPRKRNKNPGVRMVGGRIYDSEQGKCCHQCRQKTRDFMAPCKRTSRSKPCTIKFCHKCLLNRYGEKAEEVTKLKDWSCPRCRGLCNCSFCMKKKGQKPTGNLVHTAKATGFSSVLQLLYQKESEGMDAENEGLATSERSLEPLATGIDDKEDSVAKGEDKNHLRKLMRDRGSRDIPKCQNSDMKQERENTQGNVLSEDSTGLAKNGLLTAGKKKQGSVAEARPPKLRKLKKLVTDIVLECGDRGTEEDKESLAGEVIELNSIKKELSVDDCEKGASVDENTCNAKAMPLPKISNPRKCDATSLSEPKIEDVVLPRGTPLTTVAGVELPDDDVGPALQFLEFCNAFSKVLDIRNGQAQAILQGLASECIGHRKALVQFHIKLLSVIRKDMGEKSLSNSPSSGNSWLQALGKCISESQCALKELPLDYFNGGSSGYDSLDRSTKLRILNFLCDESLGTQKIRSWIDKENTTFVERKRKFDENVLAAKKKEKDLKQKLKDDMAKAMLSLRDGALLSVSAHDKLTTEIRIQTEKAYAEMRQSINCLPEKKQRPDAVRTEPMLLKGSRHAYWKLRGYCVNSNILFQDMENCDLNTLRDKWFTFDEEEEKVVEKHISLLRSWRPKRRKGFAKIAPENVGERCNNSESLNCSTEGGIGI